MRWIVLLLAVISAGGILLSWAFAQDNKIDAVEMNRIIREYESSYESDGSDKTGGTPHEFSENIARFINSEAERLNSRNLRVAAIFFVTAGLLALTFGAFALHQYITVIKPFRRMEAFASRVAQGDLSFTLEMDRQNRFGAFSESFDLMREQLEIARENERLANISKKELVASLSHDIKTPVTLIKVIAELYQAKHGDVAELGAIIQKADHIDLLISNMFTATLEELKQLKVNPSEMTTVELAETIRVSDYQGKAKAFTLPECVVMADPLRLNQVIDNIIGNSYKYANTDIEVTGEFEQGYFVLILRDYGEGVTPDELPMLCEKFYRAGNAEGKSGSGLGLYLSQYFIREMGGLFELKCDGGLWVIIKLKM